MKLLFERLSRICGDNPLRKKILVMPSLMAGNALLQSFSLAGYGFINLHINTVSGIAFEVTAPRLRREGLTPLPGVLAGRMIQEIMEERIQDSALSYFHTLQVSPRIAAAILSALQDLEEVGHNPALIPAEKFISRDKGGDMKRIAAAYQKKLSQKGLIDRIGLLKLALECKAFCLPETIFLIPTNLGTTPLEREFLARLTKDNTWASLPLEEVRGLKAPAHYFFEHAPVDTVDRPADHMGSALGCIYGRQAAPFTKEGLPEITFYHAYGETAEVREVIRQIKLEKIRLEEAVVYYTSREPYAQLFFEEARRIGIPVTFGEGIGVGNFLPGALFFALVEWIKTDFNVAVLYRLMESSAFKVDPSREPQQDFMAWELRASNIVRGRKRYEKWIEAQQIDKPGGDGEFAGSPGTEGLRNLLQGLLAAVPIPGPDGLISPGELAAGLVQIMKQRSSIAGEGDGGAYGAILENLELIAHSPAENATMEEALKWVEDIVAALQVARSLPEAGSLHIDGYRSGIWSTRSRVFVVGLDARKFPGQVTEDPVLLDLEREELSGRLRKYRFQPAEKLHEMVRLLAERGTDSRKITLSFPSFNTVESRDESPSPLLLQVYRMVTGNTRADYSSLLKKLGLCKGFVPHATGESLDAAEWWMQNLIPRREPKALEALALQCYPHLKKGLYSRRQRNSSSFTAYDGDISPPEPLWEDGRFLSASSLEQFGKCPYSYYLKYVLQISPPDEGSYDPEKWLNSLTRGTLLHRIYEDFYRVLLEQKEKPSYARHWDLLESIARARLEQQQEELPPPHQVIYTYECKEILDSCRLFLRSETEYASSYTPAYLELTFGIKGEINSGMGGELPPVKLTLPSGRYFQLRGKIDRVDRCMADDSYVVLDYKTGGTYAYRFGDRFRGGRQLQHTLYGLALEAILIREGICVDSEPPIRECGYLFPTLKGEGQRVMRPYEECKAQVFEILDCMCEILNRGSFVMTIEPEDDCAYCEYSWICEMGTFGEAVKIKVKSCKSGALAHFYKMRQLK